MKAVEKYEATKEADRIRELILADIESLKNNNDKIYKTEDNITEGMYLDIVTNISRNLDYWG